MQSFEYTIVDPVGMHARPVGFFAREAKTFRSTITVMAKERSVDGKNLIALMGLGVKCGETITVSVEGTDEETAAERLKEFIRETL